MLESAPLFYKLLVAAILLNFSLHLIVLSIVRYAFNFGAKLLFVAAAAGANVAAFVYYHHQLIGAIDLLRLKVFLIPAVGGFIIRLLLDSDFKQCKNKTANALISWTITSTFYVLGYFFILEESI